MLPFGTIRAFFLWYENEVEPEGWTNPIRKIKAPKVPIEPLEPVPFESVAQMVKSCERGMTCPLKTDPMFMLELVKGSRSTHPLGSRLLVHFENQIPTCFFMSKRISIRNNMSPSTNLLCLWPS
jgi:hypothetical protein